MTHARSFGKLLESKEELRESVTNYGERIAAKLRKNRLAARSITVFLETNPFREQDRQYRASANVPFPVPTNFTPEIVSKALEILEKIFREGFRYKKAGIMLFELVPEDQVQGELFDTVDRVKARNLMSALDGVNNRHGRDALGFAGAHVGIAWKARFEKRTERFTTRWDELPVVAA
jgi:DNA polymerase V